MKKLLFAIFALSVVVSVTYTAHALTMSGFPNSSADWDKIVEHTLREEQEGKELWEAFQAKQIACVDFGDEQFGVLGEYSMGMMVGNSHSAMNARMIQVHGEDGQEQIHIVLGKRLSGCNTPASITGISGVWMSMMQMMWGGWSPPFGSNQTNNSMMNFGFMPFGGFGWIFMVLWWVLITVGIIVLIKWLIRQSRGVRNHEKSALDILKERYAKGEIDKKEFEERKRDLI